MGLLYNATKWLDHVTQYPMRRRITKNDDETYDLIRAEGEIIQQGTARNAKNYNNMESGILGNQIHLLVLGQQMLQVQRACEDTRGEFGVITVTNANRYPFASAAVTVPIKEKRSNLDYVVEVEIVSSNGNVEQIEVFDKQLNGFKIRFTGSAKSAEFKYKLTGGRY